MNHFSIGLWHAKQSGFYMTTGDAQLSAGVRSSKHGSCVVVCCLSDPLKLSESQRNHYILEICSANWWDAPKTATPAAGIGQQKGPDSSPWQHPRNQYFKSWMNWAMEFCLIHHIHLTSQQPMTTFSSISTTFCRPNASTSSRRQIMLSKSLSNSKAQIFYATGINLFLVGKNVLIIMVPILINKCVFPPSYNDLKLWSETIITYAWT